MTVPLRSLVIYEVFVRQHGPTGTFADVASDLERIRSMGVDVVWLMPIHPIGTVARKGTLGSPYSIVDHRAVNPEYGTLADFRRLVDRIHALGMRVMIDVVYNHTAHDSRLVAEHPEFFHQGPDGRPVTTVPDWSDVIDLRHGDPALTEELITTLEAWVDLGVDGFRCDVASIVPAGFWRMAIDRVAERRPGVLWLAESVHAGWVGRRRAEGLPAWSDGELHAAGFDLTYDYDIWAMFQAAVQGLQPVGRYLELIGLQACIYPANAVKLRATENHDNPRIMWLAPDPRRARAWTAFAAFQPGALLLYAGQETGTDHTPSLFERDPIDWRRRPLQGFLTRIAALKKEPVVASGRWLVLAAEPAIQAAWVDAAGGLYGIFNTGPAAEGDLRVQLPDGAYLDLLRDERVAVREGTLRLPADAAVLRLEMPVPLVPMRFDLLDHWVPVP